MNPAQAQHSLKDIPGIPGETHFETHPVIKTEWILLLCRASGDKDGMDIVAMPLGNSETVKANAAYIVRACNNAQRLADALKAALPILDDAREDAKAKDRHKTVAESFTLQARAAREALAQWEGGAQ